MTEQTGQLYTDLTCWHCLKTVTAYRGGYECPDCGCGSYPLAARTFLPAGYDPGFAARASHP